MPGPFDDLAPLASTYAAEDFMAQRKRLREARARWIDEHECPTASVIEHTDEHGNPILDKDGKPKVTAIRGPFQTGKIRDESLVPPSERGFKPTFLPAPEEQGSTPAADLGEILEEVQTFIAPGIYRESPHPEIREGEDYGHYCARVGREYERAAGENAVRRPVPDSDDLRGSSADHPGDERGTPAAGASDCGEDRPAIRDHAGSDDPGDAGERGSPSVADAAGDGATGQPGAAAGVSTG